MRQKKSLLIISLLLLAGTSSVALAEPGDDIKYRKSVMKAIGGHMGAIAAIMQGKAGHAKHLRSHAIGLNAASKSVRDTFQAGSADGETRALAAVWDKPAEFKQVVSKFETAADGFLKAVDTGDQSKIGAAMKELGGSCKACHDDFREKKQ